MNMIAAAFSNELTKIFWRAKYRAMIAVYAAVGLGSGLMGASGFSVRLIREFSYNIIGTNVVYGSLSLYRSLLLPLAIFMLSADIFTHELESKSIKCVLTRPVSRFDAYLAKCLAMLCYVAATLGVGYVVAQAWQIIFSIFGGNADPSASVALIESNLLREARPATFMSQAASAAEALTSYALTLMPMAAFIAFASFIAVALRSPALVMFICIASYCVLYFLGIMYNGVGAALFTTYTSWYRMWLGERLPWRSLLAASGLLLSTCVAFFGFGYFAFEKKDI
jgi:ABC-2 type transport system permease protein